MTKEELFKIKIDKPDSNAYDAACRHWDGIAKPLDGLGKLEDMVKKIAAVAGNADVDISKKAVIIMCADNGIIEEGVSQSGCDVTAIVSANMAKGIASVCRMAKIAGADCFPVNIGIKFDIEEDNLIDRRISRGTKNFLKEPAMTENEVLDAFIAGIDIVRGLKGKGYNIIATGEMGIGNTTTSSTIASVLLNKSVRSVTGSGAGLDNEGIENKINVIEHAIKRYNFDKFGAVIHSGQKPDIKKSYVWEILRCVGGLDIAGLCGVFAGGAIYHIPVVIDGVISAVAALVAEKLLNGCRNYMLPSHAGREPACREILNELDLVPVIDADLALGEGTGAVLLFPMLDMAMEVYRENTTFNDINIGQYVRYDK